VSDLDSTPAPRGTALAWRAGGAHTGACWPRAEGDRAAIVISIDLVSEVGW